MNFESQNHLIFEMKKVKQAIKEKDSYSLKLFYDEYLKKTAIPKREVFKHSNLTICSSKYSYHLLSIYLLLDVIDFYWDGKKFFDREIRGDFSLMNELGVNEKTYDLPFEEAIKITEKVDNILRDDLYIFLVPYRFKEDYVVKMAYPGNVLLVYHNKEEFSVDTILEGIGEFYLKKKLKSSLPYWAKNKDVFKKEFVSWCKDESSLFRS